MHICLATPEFPPTVDGGIATYYSNLAEIFADQGHAVTVLTGIEEDASREWQYPNVTVVRVSATLRRRHDQLRQIFDPELRRVSRTIATGLAMRDWLRANSRQKGIDVVETVEFGGVAPLLLDLDLPPVLVTCHGAVGQLVHHGGGSRTGTYENFLSALEAISISLADEVACYSPLNARDWHLYLGRQPVFVRAPFKVHPDTGSIRQGSEPLIGIVVGRMNNWKGIFELVDSLSMCLDRGLKLKIRWVGRDQAAPLEGLDSVKEHLSKSYPAIWGQALLWEEFLPPEQVRVAQREADFAVVPSRWDTFNFTAIEAMACGTPLVITATTGASYLCKNRVNSLVVPATDPSALAQAFQRLGDPALRERLGRAGQRTVAEEFQPNRIITDRISAYQSAIARHDYRQKHPYTPSVMNPFVLQWLRSVDLSTSSAQIARLSGRDMVRETLRRLWKRLSLLGDSGS